MDAHHAAKDLRKDVVRVAAAEAAEATTRHAAHAAAATAARRHAAFQPFLAIRIIYFPLL